jgi:hypothetical protein
MSGELRKLRTLMRPKHPRDRLLALNASGVHDLMGSCLSVEQPGSYEINRSYVEALRVGAPHARATSSTLTCKPPVYLDYMTNYLN